MQKIGLVLTVGVMFLACEFLQPLPEIPDEPTTTPIVANTITLAARHITQVWANEGGDKVTRDELRATHDPDAVHNSVWDGKAISLFGAHNEVVAFNLVLEAPTADATNVNVMLPVLLGSNGAKITTTQTTGDGVFNYLGRNIEFFYVRYLEIEGMSTYLTYPAYARDERAFPARCRRPHNADGVPDPITGWLDRPCHNQFYPDIAVPLELNSPFTIAHGTNQSIWGDIYIPKTTPTGYYTGTIIITENGAPTWQVEVNLRVRDFTLPDLPTARTMVYFSSDNINDRYVGDSYPASGSAVYSQSLLLLDRHFQLAHRHKISLIGDYVAIEAMDETWTDALSGELFTSAKGYAGVGAGVGNNVYSIGTYGQWPWRSGGREDMWANTDAWVNWFENQGFTNTDYFLYLIDESSDYEQIQLWASRINTNPGPGQRLMSMVTLPLPVAAKETPALDIPTSGGNVGITEEWQNAAEAYQAAEDKRFYMYNGDRPATGTFTTEEDGVALRALAWTQYKKKIDRWFYWEATYYDNFQGNTGQTNVFRHAQTYGNLNNPADPILGATGKSYVNGNGVLMYPGTDVRYPEDSYGVMGPFASLRLKYWRRGIQDVDYLMLASQMNPTRTAQIVTMMVPTVLWEYGATDPLDPTWVYGDVSWSTDPDSWEAVRGLLANVIENYYENFTSRVYLPVLVRVESTSRR